MCGLYGIYSQNLGKREVDWFVQLGLHSLKRGMDSTGLVLVDRKNIRWHKAVKNAGLFFNDPKISRDLHRKNVVLLMGHNRSATIGEVGLQQSHPFSHGSIIGCHNGTIFDADYRPTDDVVSDSDHLFKNISLLGLEETAQAIINGALALSYIDKDRHCFYLVRNSKRPLHVVWNKGGTIFIWASDDDFIEAVIKDTKIKWEEVTEIPTETLLTINYVTNTVEETEVTLEPPKNAAAGQWNSNYKKHEAHKKVTVSPPLIEHQAEKDYDYARDAWRGGPAVPKGYSNGGGSLSGMRMLKGRSNEKATEETTEELMGYYGDLKVPQKTIDRLLKRGCCYCQDPHVDDEEVHWVSYSHYICFNCLADPQVLFFLTEGELNHLIQKGN